MLFFDFEISLADKLAADAFTVLDNVVDTQLQGIEFEGLCDVGIGTCFESRHEIFSAVLAVSITTGQLSEIG